MKRIALLLVLSILFGVFALNISAKTIGGEKTEDCSAGHIYSNGCDMLCDRCNRIRIVEDHVFSLECDVDCDECGYVRGSIIHTYDNADDAECNFCSHKRLVVHIYEAETNKDREPQNKDDSGENDDSSFPKLTQRDDLMAAGKIILWVVIILAIVGIAAFWGISRVKKKR